ncbi:phosphoribosylamine--glycine ligase [Acidihalobacter yilgarnensis]|uniref:Phosphoribosylamine--glycine ligase n=1 Tax=Acidihalobacter yilgarnensis TaxID=2819280 RepID=A0A1D8IKM0_9GAMM|nr:phosphoribosylamine--glycine ligase [Acidihalobacter yilgarnensis]AOU97019.1 phosphoribosylamine--glycine ligase [Acidihalobacter yilgarnensis]
MNVLVIGGGGREHALAWKLAQSASVETVYVAPGNAGTASEPGIRNVPLAANDIPGLLRFADEAGIHLTVVGPEAPLVAGIVDTFRDAGHRIFGPTRDAARLEGSKAFSKDFLHRHRIPTARYGSFTEIAPALDFIHDHGAPIVVKADGLAAGKGVVVAQTQEEARTAVHEMLAGNAFGEAGHRVVIEEFLRGEEASFICMVDGVHVLPMATSQDHKARDDGDLGPNTGGMGAYSPAPVVTPEIHARILREVIEPTVIGMASEGTPYTGFLYAGVMIDAEGTPKVLEFNCRFGDPETQPIMLRLRSDLYALIESAVDGQLEQASANWDPRVALGVVLAAQGYPETYLEDERLDPLPADDDDRKLFHAGTRLMGEHVVSAGGRVLCATGLGDTVSEARTRAYALADAVAWPGKYYRTDIGHRALSRSN